MSGTLLLLAMVAQAAPATDPPSPPAPTPPAKDDNPPEVETSLEPRELRVGEQLTFELLVTHDGTQRGVGSPPLCVSNLPFYSGGPSSGSSGATICKRLRN